MKKVLVLGLILGLGTLGYVTTSDVGPDPKPPVSEVSINPLPPVAYVTTSPKPPVNFDIISTKEETPKPKGGAASSGKGSVPYSPLPPVAGKKKGGNFIIFGGHGVEFASVKHAPKPVVNLDIGFS